VHYLLTSRGGFEICCRDNVVRQNTLNLCLIVVQGLLRAPRLSRALLRGLNLSGDFRLGLTDGLQTSLIAGVNFGQALGGPKSMMLPNYQSASGNGKV